MLTTLSLEIVLPNGAGKHRALEALTRFCAHLEASEKIGAAGWLQGDDKTAVLWRVERRAA